MEDSSPKARNAQAPKTLRTIETRNHGKIMSSAISKRNYIKFCSARLAELNTFYETNHYPSKDEMSELAEKFNEKLSKIDNWFKHKRRKEVQSGLMKFEKKKVFSKEEVEVLTEEFLEDRHPNFRRYTRIAERLHCKVKHVKNWFSYKRKLLLKIQRSQRSAMKSSCKAKRRPEKKASPEKPPPKPEEKSPEMKVEPPGPVKLEDGKRPPHCEIPRLTGSTSLYSAVSLSRFRQFVAQQQYVQSLWLSQQNPMFLPQWLFGFNT